MCINQSIPQQRPELVGGGERGNYPFRKEIQGAEKKANERMNKLPKCKEPDVECYIYAGRKFVSRDSRGRIVRYVVLYCALLCCCSHGNRMLVSQGLFTT